MKAAHVRFYAELNDLLAPERRGGAFYYPFWTEPSVKDLIESCGVPHTEVDLVLINGVSAGFEQRVTDGDAVSVYPVFEAIDIASVLKVRPEPLRQIRFVLDIHLGKLARYLRMMGFDTFYRKDTGDAELARISREDQRILLTRDRGLLMRSMVTHGHYVRETGARRQLEEVLGWFDLYGKVLPFTRCMACNGLLETALVEDVEGAIPAGVRQEHDRFQRCQGCGKVYWEGSHHHRMRGLIESVLAGDALSGVNRTA